MIEPFDEKSAAVLEALSLNDKQKEAVLINDRPLLILAGAGSGKTRTIISKIVYDILVLDTDPHNILAVTFTNKAAEEMRTRLSLYLGEARAKNVEIRTFHSFGANFLRFNANRIGLNPAFAIYDDKDALSLLKTKYPDISSKELKPVVEKILEAKERGFNVNNYLEYFDSHTDIHEYFKVYDKLLRESGNVDLPELISLPTKALSSDVELRKETQNRYKRIFVDEYQDTNGAQFALLKCLVGDGNIICVVGDDDQSIYSFRGSEVQHILEFTDYFKGAATVKLEENYRSSASIIALASALIKNNKQRHDKTLWTGNPKGELPRLIVFDTERDEAAFIASELKNDMEESSAILYRTNAQGAAFEDALLNRRLLYHVLRGNSFYERADIKDTVALMALTLNPYDVVAFLRIANKPARALGDTAQNTIIDFASLYCSGNLIEALKTVKLTKKATDGALELAGSIERAKDRLGKDQNSDFLRSLLMESGLYAYYAALDEKEGNTTDSHIDALEALAGQVDSFEQGEQGIIMLMEQMALVSSQDTKTTEGVALSTVHGVKGLEFDRVYITGLEDGLFPLTRSDSVEEERRLMYVAITRARKNLTLTLSLSRFKYGRREIQKPSPYIKELDKSNFTLFNRSSVPNEKIVARLFKSVDDSGYESSKQSYNSYSYQNKNLYQNSKKSYNSYSGSNSANSSSTEVLARLRKASELDNNADYHKVQTSRDVSRSEAESLPFKVLDRVEHPDDSYGKGRVARVRMLKNRYVMDVHFDNGRDSVFPMFNTKLRKI